MTEQPLNQCGSGAQIEVENERKHGGRPDAERKKETMAQTIKAQKPAEADQ